MGGNAPEYLDKIADENPSLKGIINTVRWNEPAPDGSGGKRLDPTVLSALINYLITDLSNKNVSVDVLGDAYEYLISRFADENKGGTTAGQFYTPQEVVDIIVRYLKPQKNDTVYDPTCGSGGFLINSAKYCRANYGNQKAIRLFGQENVWNTWAICNINMILHGLDARIEQGDTILHPKFTDEDNELKIRTFNKVMANFPFSQENWAKNGTPKKDAKGRVVNKKDGSPQLEYKKTYTDPYERLSYGMPPYSNGDFTFLQHIIASLDENGKAGVVCPQGILFRGQPAKTEKEDGLNRKADDEYLIRHGLLNGIVDENGEQSLMINIVDAIVVLPSNLFYGTTIPGAIFFVNKNKPKKRKDKVLMVYAAKDGWYKEDPNMNVLQPQDVLRISTILESWGDLDVAKTWIISEKKRLKNLIQEELDFQLTEIEEYYSDDIFTQSERLKNAEKIINDKILGKNKPTKSNVNAVEAAQKALEKLLTDKDAKKIAAHELADKQRKSLDNVELEIIAMLQDEELRKRYFSVVDKKEIEENEFNLNIPRYVDTFEQEEQIDLQKAIEDFRKATKTESKLDKTIDELLKILK